MHHVMKGTCIPLMILLPVCSATKCNGQCRVKAISLDRIILPACAEGLKVMISASFGFLMESIPQYQTGGYENGR